MATEQTETQPAKKLLSLDGGGVKGISSLMILKAIMEEVQKLEDGHHATIDQTKPGAIVTAATTILNERKPVDYFDLAGGTSTGGLIAVLVGHLGMTCSEAICTYQQLADTIFAVRIFGYNISKSPFLKFLGPVILKIRILFGTQFSSKYLDEAIDKILAQYVPPSDPHDPNGEPYLVAPRFNPYDAKGKSFMCATMANRGKAILFRNYTPPVDAIPETGHPDNRNQDQETGPDGHQREQQQQQQQQQQQLNNSNFQNTTTTPTTTQPLRTFDYNTVTIKKAARATSAAPTYLPPEFIQKIQFWDGGLLNNNPIDQVWSARYDLTPTDHDEPYISTVLSLGCTWTESSHPSKSQPTGLLTRLIGILSKSLSFATNTEAKHMDFLRNMHRRNKRQPEPKRTAYFRFNAPLGKVRVDLADFGKMEFLKGKTKEFLSREDTKKKIADCARLLAKRVVK